MTDIVLKTISVEHKIVDFKKHLSTVVETSRKLHCNKFSADSTYLIFHSNGPVALLSYRYLLEDNDILQI